MTEPARYLSFYLPASVTAALFALVQIVALLLVPQYEYFGYQAFGPQGETNPLIPLLYIAFLIVFTFFLIWIFKMKKGNLLRVIFIFIMSISAIYVLFPVFILLLPSFPDFDFYLSVGIMVAIAIALWLYPEWYVVDTWGFIMAAGITAIFGISLGLLPSFVLLTAMALYDFIAVYRTKHMISLAEGAMDLNLPIMMMVPRKIGFSNFSKKVPLASNESEQREALYIGLGDMIIPGVLTVSAYANLPSTPILSGLGGGIMVALGCLAGAFAGFVLLMHLTSKGRPQAGLPLLNTGTIAGFLLSYLLVFHNFSFGFLFQL